MKTMFITVLLVISFAAGIWCTAGDQAGVPERPPAQEVPWHLVAQSPLAMVYVEKALYEKKGSPCFYMKVRITNRSSDDIYCDLRDYGKVIYPNQWGLLHTAPRQNIDERRAQLAALDEQAKADVLDAFSKKQLTGILAGASYEYFRAFSASGRSDVEEQESKTQNAKWLFVSMDGQLLLTDGHTVEQISCSWKKVGALTDVVLPLPITWKAIPEAAIVVEER